MIDADSKFSGDIVRLGIDVLLQNTGRVVVAYSGGADSSLLLVLLQHYLDGSGITLEAAHLNHMIRGDEADRDEYFCRETAERLGIRLYVRRRDVPALAKGNGSLESIARRERYCFFDSICQNSSVPTLVATAHNADDNLETVLFNLMRGSGTRGMCGIPPVRDGRYIRPLLGFTGKEVRSICQESSIRFVLDSTNAEDDYTRNRIRQRIVPEISTLSPAVQNAVLRMCSSLREDSDFIDNAANEFPLEKGTANQAALAQLHPAVRSRVLQRMWHLASGKKVCALEAVHIRDISTLLGKGGTFRLSTPGGLTFYADGGYARFVSLTDNQPADIDECEYVIEPGNGSIILNGYAVTVTLVFPQDIKSVPAQYDENIYNLSINKSVSFDKIKGKLMLRTRRPGDVLRYGGMSRSVKKLMSSGHIPFDERARLPVFSDDEGIVWIPGFPVRDGMKPSVGERCIVINIHREGAE